MAAQSESKAEGQAIQLHLSCHCRTFTSTLTIPSSAFPLRSALCHCTMCRQISGHPFATFAVIPLPNKPSTDGLAAYAHTSSVTRWFCKKCGAGIWNDDHANDEWEVATGTIDGVSRGQNQASIDTDRDIDNEDGLEKIDGLLQRVQLFVGADSTGDGGAAIWLNGGVLDANMDRKLYARQSASATDEMLRDMVEKAKNAPAITSDSSSNDKDQDRTISAHCACNRVQMSITRPDTRTKYATGLDACTSCRKTSGFEITSWATVPIDHITITITPDDNVGGSHQTPLNFDDSTSTSTMTRYDTSNGQVSRYFCPKCSATIFYRLLSRQTTVDIGVGLFDHASSGVRLDEHGGWLSWHKYQDPRVVHADDAIDLGFVARLVEGFHRYDSMDA